MSGFCALMASVPLLIGVLSFVAFLAFGTEALELKEGVLLECIAWGVMAVWAELRNANHKR